MLGENIDTSKADAKLIQDLADAVERARLNLDKLLVVGLCGESGSGKSVVAKALSQKLIQLGKNSYVIQMDDYFLLPPRETSELRSQSLDHVGPSEVDLELLDETIEKVKREEYNFKLPVMHFIDNRREWKENAIPKNLDVLIVEGTYIFLLQHIDLKVFLSRTYRQTHIHRVARLREPQTELIEKVLEIEHQIVSPLVAQADYIIDPNFELIRK